MTTKLNKAIDQIKSLIGEDKVLQKEFENVIKQVHKKNEHNIGVHIPIGEISETLANLTDESCYRVITYKKVDDEGKEWESLDDYKEHLLENVNIKFSQYSVVKVEETNTFAIQDEDGDIIVDDLADEMKAKETIRNLKEEYYESKVQAFAHFDDEYDEVMWNEVYQYNGHVNEAVAKEVGLGVLEFRKGELKDEKFLFLLGSGVDLSPIIVAYKALVYGYISESDVKHFTSKTSRRFFQKVATTRVYKKVVEKLKISHIIEQID